MSAQESEPDGHYGRWKMEDCNLGSAGCQPAGFGSLPKQSSLNQTRLCERIAGWQPALPNPKTEKEMPDRASLAIRHLVDVQLAAAKTELCVTVVFSELWFLSIPKSLRHVPLDDQLIHPKDLAVDLCLRAIRNSKVESRKLRGLNF